MITRRSRKPTTPDEALERMRREYTALPGMRLNAAQAQRLLGVERTACERLLKILIDSGFLAVQRDGTYVRADVGDLLPEPEATTPGAMRRAS